METLFDFALATLIFTVALPYVVFTPFLLGLVMLAWNSDWKLFISGIHYSFLISIVGGAFVYIHLDQFPKIPVF